MINYVTLGVSDIAKATDFYLALLADMGARKLVDMERIVFIGKSMDAPMLAVCHPYDKQAPQPGNGNMLSFAAGSKQNVDRLYQQALALGGRCEGAPGQRIAKQFYGAYIRDLDGNKVCFSYFG